ncbi:TadE/TadG family type IV pilus assembly protein [Allorhizobium pseudoryzae]|uniref:TadE/TadG family type IV pilus assembly protein n=1 Tax=Allorhizobium pseudoryzae TaxID=379684 RepID=UPI003D00EF00
MTRTRLVADRRGSFGVLTALVLPVVILGVGIAVDYGLALDASQKLKAASDAAVLGAIGEAQEAYIRQEKVDLQDLIREAGEEFFKANQARMVSIRLQDVDVVPRVNKNELSAELTYTASYSTSLLKIFGYNEIPISSSSHAAVNVRSFVNINLLIDVSASMGIGATSLDQQKVASAVNCAFACHINSARGSSPYDTARAAGATMRIDVARNAAISAVDVSKETAEFADQVTFGLYKFSNELTTVVSHADARASNYSYLKTALRDEILLDMTNGGTNIGAAISSLTTLLPKSGSGLRADDRIQYVIVLTDGVESGQAWTAAKNWFKHPSTKEIAPYKAYATHEVNYALDPATCDKAQKKDVDIFFIYTEYLEPIYGEFGDHDKQRFQFVTDTLFPLIPKRFASCTADANNVIKVTTPAEIEQTFTRIVKGLSAPLRLY